MRKITLVQNDDRTISFCNLDGTEPIFAKKGGGKLRGMVVKEEKGWILRLGGSAGATGWHDGLRECLESCVRHGHEFFVE